MIIPVPSSTPGKTYDVVYQGADTFWCPCPGFKHRQRCRHIPLAQAARQKQLEQAWETIMKVTLSDLTVETLDKLLANKTPCSTSNEGGDPSSYYHFNRTGLLLLMQATVKLERQQSGERLPSTSDGHDRRV